MKATCTGSSPARFYATLPFVRPIRQGLTEYTRWDVRLTQAAEPSKADL
jgi:hypothetical protein